MEPRTKEIAVALRAILAVPGAGPHLSYYWQHCPDQSRPEVGRQVNLPPAFTFLEWLYLIGLECGEDDVLRGIGRQAFYAMLTRVGGKIAVMVEGVEKVEHWRDKIRTGRAEEFLEFVQGQYGIGAYYAGAVPQEIDEEGHRQHIPAEVVAAMPWEEVTLPWILEKDASEPWYCRQDLSTTQALAELVSVSFRFDPQFQRMFWETMGPADLVRTLSSSRFATLIAQLRYELLSDEMLAATFLIPEVVARMPRERIERYLEILWTWLGGVELAVETPVPPRASGAPPPLPAENEFTLANEDSGEEDVPIGLDPDGFEDFDSGGSR